MEPATLHSTEYQLTNTSGLVGDVDDRPSVLDTVDTEFFDWKAPKPDYDIETPFMYHPLDNKWAFSYLGLMLGAFPPSAFFLLFLTSVSRVENGVIALMALVTMVTAVTGFCTGKVVGNVLTKLNDRSLPFLAVVVPLIGIAWGVVCGAAGGLFIFIIGAIFGAVIGGVVGMVALPAFFFLHRSIATEGLIERSQFLPVASGVTLSICAFILSFAGR